MAMRQRNRKRFRKQNVGYIPKRQAKSMGLWTAEDAVRGYHIEEVQDGSSQD